MANFDAGCWIVRLFPAPDLTKDDILEFCTLCINSNTMKRLIEVDDFLRDGTKTTTGRKTRASV
jgi:hypothetical protein